ncbi:MAG: response regulator transcription factor [Acidimicrobiales bacterium]|nr:response regulator transcription factor [Acidimicrobiales bacterium]
MSGGSIRMVICDDHQVVRRGLLLVLNADPEITVIGDVGTSGAVVAVAAECHPDVVLLDLGLPDSGGIDTIAKIHQVSPTTKVLILTMHDDIAYLREAFAAGAHGYVVKAAADTELLQAVHAVAAGERYVHPALGASMLTVDRVNEKPHETGTVSKLSEREVEVLRLLALGYTNSEMATMLQLSIRTVETYRYRLQQKVGLRSRAELARLARESGIS